MKKKILIFKNDRGGDLISSIRLIHNLMKDNDVDIYLSELNFNFKFLAIVLLSFKLLVPDKIFMKCNYLYLISTSFQINKVKLGKL